MNDVINRLVDVLAHQKPATADACEEMLATQLKAMAQDQLRIALEQTLASHDQFRSYLRELEGRLPRPSPWSDPFDNDTVTRVAQSGLRVLSPGQLARLAVSPMLLLDLWDAIGDEELSPYWLEVVNRRMQADGERRGRKFASMQEMVASAKRAAGIQPASYVQRAAGQVPSDKPGSATVPQRWEREIRLDQAEWLSRENPDTAAVLESERVGLEFTWLVAERPHLEVRFIRGPLTLSTGRWATTLIDRQGQELASGQAGEDCLVFDQLPPGGVEALGGVRLSCTLSVPGTFQLRFEVPLDPDIPETHQ